MCLDRGKGWCAAGKPRFEILHLARKVSGANVPLPVTLLRLVLGLTLPRLLHRSLLLALPPELGQYLLTAACALNIAGSPLPIPILPCMACLYSEFSRLQHIPCLAPSTPPIPVCRLLGPFHEYFLV